MRIPSRVGWKDTETPDTMDRVLILNRPRRRKLPNIVREILNSDEFAEQLNEMADAGSKGARYHIETWREND